MSNNAKWLIFCRFFQALLQMGAGMLVARYLGPVEYGALGYASSVAAFAIPVAQLGLNATLVQELGNDPRQEGEILGTAGAMQVLAGLVCLPVTGLFSLAVRPGDRDAAVICLLYGTSLVFQAGELLQYWFHVHGNMRTAAVTAVLASVAVCAGKIGLMTAGKGVLWFAVGNSIQLFLWSLLLWRNYRGGRLRISRKMARRLLGKGKYYIAAGWMLVVFHNTDHIMLTRMAGEGENGIYTAAMTCAGAAGFLYSGLLEAAKPAVLEAGRCSDKALEETVIRLYRLILGLALGESLAVTLLAKPITGFLYGPAYARAARVLQLLVWYLAFSYMGSVRNLWILAKEKHRLLGWINLGMALGNVVLNSWLIPGWGAMGAAGATVLTQILGNFLLGFFWKPLRENNRLMLRAMGRKQ